MFPDSQIPHLGIVPERYIQNVYTRYTYKTLTETLIKYDFIPTHLLRPVWRLEDQPMGAVDNPFTDWLAGFIYDTGVYGDCLSFIYWLAGLIYNNMVMVVHEVLKIIVLHYYSRN